ncbi:MAG: starch-binding protein [Lachnospiraceae bacterium]|nr:starch-binding protein [Lachnospiraceae bacterium]
MKKGVMKRWLSIILAIIMIFSNSAFGTINTYAAEKVELTEVTADSSLDAASDYGLMENAADGVILHAWNWSFNSIKASMQDIAEAGYTSVQTSPVQRPKDYSQGCTYGDWWKVYQPTSICFSPDGHPWFGTKQEFKEMCDEAEKYGINVIVDIVANHMANNTGQIGNTRADISSQNDPYIRDDDSCWHLNGSTGIDYGNQHRNGDNSSLTHGFGGWPDLNTGNKKVQNAVIDLLKECVDLGADGFRFDAAKHIELPTDPGGSSDFWPTVTSAIENYATSKGIKIYNYGEILDDSATEITNYTKYMAVTDNRAGNGIREAIRQGNVAGAANSALTYNGVPADSLVLWAESHDTYANDAYTGPSTKSSQEVINKTWAIVAARDFAALYYIRPNSTALQMGQPSQNDNWKSSQVAEVNKFHNYFNGQKEYMASSGDIAYVERGTAGVVLVNVRGGSQQVSVKANLMADGTYKDQVSGGTFTVSGGQISGNIGNTGIAVVYNAAPVVKTPMPTISREGGNFSGDTLKLTIGLKNATSGTYKIGNAAAETYTTTKDIVIGSDMAFGDSVKIILTATGEGKTETKEYTFTKVDKVVNKAYLAKPSDWPDTVYCYAYDSATEKISNGVWPGVQMTKDAETGYYVYEIPENIEKPRVIFNCGLDDNNVHRHPEDQMDGELFETDGSWIYKDGKWEKYNSPVTEQGKVTVSYVDGSGNKVADSKTLTGNVGDTYTTTAAVVSGYNLKTTPSNATGKYTKADITVTYVYEKASDDSITITSSLAEGTTFDTETKTITLTITNATSGTYSVDDGPVKTFTGSADVVIGQGKIADTEVKVDATATNGTDTVKKTFTYNKKFSGNTANEKLSAASAVAVAMDISMASSTTLASQYSTNKAGVGVEKTISVDGDISDWNESMKIAQGAANDDPRVYRPNSMYENPVDLYALYGAYDDNNVYLMWEMTNVQDVVAPSDNYPLSQGTLWQTQEFPFFIAIDTGKSNTAIGNKGATQTGGTIWDSGMTIENSFNKLISINTKGGNGPYVYGGDSSGLNAKELLGPKGTNSKVKMNFGKGILTGEVRGINGAYGENNNRVVGDIYNDAAEWVDFNTIGHDSASMDFFYELSIPYDELEITKDDIKNNGIGVLLVGTMGKSPLDCLPYDGSMNDNADLDDSAGSQENNSFEKSDEDHITCSFARLGVMGDNPTPPQPTPPTPTDDLTVNFGADRSSPQLDTSKRTLKAIAKGGKAPYKYEFSVDGNSVQSESATDSYEWTPYKGTHVIAVKVTDSEGTSVYSQKIYTIEGEGEYTAPEITEFKVSKESVTEGELIKLSASATGGQGTLEYKFTATDAKGNKTVISEYSTTKFADWAPSAGTYKLEVTVKDEKNIEVSKAINGFVVAGNVVEGPKVKSISIDKDSAIEGDSVKISAVAEGTGELQYHFTVTAEGGEEIHIQEYDTSNECNWTATTAGTYTLTVYVKDSNGKTAKKSRSGFVVNKSGQESNIKIDSFTSSKASGTAKAGESIELSVNATSNVEVTYRFAVSLDDNVTVISDYSNNSKVTWNPQVAGDYDLYVYVKDAEGYTVTKVIEGYKVNPKGSTITLEFKDFTTDKYSAIEGDTVKLTATAEGEELQYRFAVTAEGSSENIIQDYSTSNTCNWKASTAGTYTLAVSIKDSEGHMVSKEIKGYKVNPKGTVVTLNVKSISADKDSGTAIEGDTVNISATAEGKGELQYRFTVTTGGAEEVIQDYSTSSICSWKTDAAGTYTLSVYVKDGDGNIVKKSKNGYIVNQKTYQNTINVSSFTADKASGSIKAGDSVKLSVKATAQSEITYRFTVVSGDTETIISNYSKNSTITWKPETAGTYSLFVYVKDEEGNIVSKEIEGYTVKDEETPVYKEVSITSFKTSKASNTVTTGQSVKMTAKATGGSGQLKYKFIVKRSNGKSQTVRKYSSNNSCQWKPAQSGKYTLYVHVKDSSTGKVVKKSIKNYNVKQALKIKSFTQSRKSGTAAVGDKIVLKVNATGGIGKKFYKYYYKLNGKKYILKNYTASKKINWTPKKAGKYQLFVETVDDVNNKVTKKVNYVVVNKLKVKKFKATPTSVKAGRKVKLSVSATGGTKKYSYKFKYTYKNKSVVIRKYSGSSKVTWTPRKKGKYKLTVYVKDAKNRKTTKTMTLNVK